MNEDKALRQKVNVLFGTSNHNMCYVNTRPLPPFDWWNIKHKDTGFAGNMVHPQSKLGH